MAAGDDCPTNLLKALAKLRGVQRNLREALDAFLRDHPTRHADWLEPLMLDDLVAECVKLKERIILIGRDVDVTPPAGKRRFT